MRSESVLCYADAPTAAEAVQSWLQKGDSVLVKASRLAWNRWPPLSNHGPTGCEGRVSR